MSAAARLREAGLLDVAVAVARDHDVETADLLRVTGRVSPAQGVLFRALAATGRDAATIARLLGWGEVAVARELAMPEPAPTPPPESVERPRLDSPPATLPEALFADLDARLRELERAAEQVIAGVRAVREDIKHHARGPALAHLHRNGDDGAAVLIAARFGVSPDMLLSGSMKRNVCQARRAVAEEYERRGMSRTGIQRMLNLGPGAVYAMLGKGSK